jgi:hypothetical protein
MMPRLLTLLTGRSLPQIQQPQEPEPSTINEKTIEDFRRVVAQILLGSTMIIGLHTSCTAAEISGVGGTLIVTVPAAGGLIVAADTRHTTFGVSCDFGTKLYPVKKSPRILFGVTGLSEFLAVKYPFVGDPCEEVRRSPALFKVEPVVSRFLEEHGDRDLLELDISALASSLTKSFGAFVSGWPNRSELVNRSAVFTVVLASFEQISQVSVVRELSVKMPSADQLKVDLTFQTNSTPAGLPDWNAFGQGQYLVDHVINGIGRKYLLESYALFEAAGSIAGIDKSLAADTAENLIAATSKTSEIVQIPAGVGGHIDIYWLTGGEMKKLK